MKVCALLFTRSLQPQPQPPTLHRLLYQAKGSVWPAAQTSALLCRFSTGIVMMRSVGRSLTEIESVARQIWTSLGASGGCCWPFSPSPASLDLIRSLLWPSGPFKGLTSHQPGLLMEPFLHFMDAWSLISIKIIRFYLVLYIAQTVPTHPESFQTDRSRNRRYVKWIGNALPYENLNPDILFNSYWPSFLNSLIGLSGSIHLIHFAYKKVCVTWPLTFCTAYNSWKTKNPNSWHWWWWPDRKRATLTALDAIQWMVFAILEMFTWARWAGLSAHKIQIKLSNIVSPRAPEPRAQSFP